MPYITRKKRINFDFDYMRPLVAGQLNFVLTKLCHDYIEVKGLNYTTLNEVIGVLECCKLELNRQIIAKYENKKKKENGPISELDK